MIVCFVALRAPSKAEAATTTQALWRHWQASPFASGIFAGDQNSTVRAINQSAPEELSDWRPHLPRS